MNFCFILTTKINDQVINTDESTIICVFLFAELVSHNVAVELEIKRANEELTTVDIP